MHLQPGVSHPSIYIDTNGQPSALPDVEGSAAPRLAVQSPDPSVICEYSRGEGQSSSGKAAGFRWGGAGGGDTAGDTPIGDASSLCGCALGGESPGDAGTARPSPSRGFPSLSCHQKTLGSYRTVTCGANGANDPMSQGGLHRKARRGQQVPLAPSPPAPGAHTETAFLRFV